MGPVLLSLFINDLRQQFCDTLVTLYADDIIIMAASTDNIELARVCNSMLDTATT